MLFPISFNEYRKYIEKDSALERRFQPVKVAEPSIDKGGCINTLVSRHVNPVSKGTGQQSSICEVKKVGA